MTYTDLVAVERFAEKLKVNFPILLQPHNFSDRLINMHNEHTHKVIDLTVESARLEWELEVAKEASAHGE